MGEAENGDWVGPVLERTRKELVDREQRWSVSLAVGNGAGCVALGSALISAWKLDVWFALLPALWCFAFGVMVAGGAALLGLGSYRMGVRILEHHSALMTHLAKSKTPRFDRIAMGMAEEHDQLTSGYEHNELAESVLQFASAALFCAGMIWPLTVITFQLGH